MDSKPPCYSKAGGRRANGYFDALRLQAGDGVSSQLAARMYAQEGAFDPTPWPSQVTSLSRVNGGVDGMSGAAMPDAMGSSPTLSWASSPTLSWASSSNEVTYPRALGTGTSIDSLVNSFGEGLAAGVLDGFRPLGTFLGEEAGRYATGQYGDTLLGRGLQFFSDEESSVLAGHPEQTQTYQLAQAVGGTLSGIAENPQGALVDGYHYAVGRATDVITDFMNWQSTSTPDQMAYDAGHAGGKAVSGYALGEGGKTVISIFGSIASDGVDIQNVVTDSELSDPEATALRTPTYVIGESDGGPGAWANSSKYPTDPADAAYQQSATGAPPGVEYAVDTSLMKSGVKYFDGYDPNSGNLIDAKNYFDWPDTNKPFSMVSVTNDMIQSDAIAGDAGTMVEFRVASQEKANLLNSIAQQNNLTNTVVTYWKP